MEPFHLPARSAAFRVKVNIAVMVMIKSNLIKFLLICWSGRVPSWCGLQLPGGALSIGLWRPRTLAGAKRAPLPDDRSHPNFRASSLHSSKYIADALCGLVPDARSKQATLQW